MGLQIKYGGETYDVLNVTMEQALEDMWSLLEKTAGRGIYYVETPKGKVALLISHSIPLAVVEAEEPRSAYENDGIRSVG